MADSLYFDEMPNDFFNMLDDFPLEGIEVGSEKDDWDSMQFPDLPSNMQFPGLFGELQNDFPKENKNLSVSYDETCRLNQFPSSAETTSSGGGGALLSDDSSDAKPTHFFKTSSPVSILESASSCFSENPKTAAAAAATKRARTKRSRSRPSTFDRLRALPLMWAAETTTTTPASYPASSDPAKRAIPKKNPANYKKKRASPASLSGGDAVEAAGKRCSHCEVTSTPQWREGPMGPKTLCNACGVRFRSGRLFPEYRPAASPTFVPAVHSNSHKRVVEMRNKANSSHGSSNTNTNTTSSSRLGLKLYYRSHPGKSVTHLIV